MSRFRQISFILIVVALATGFRSLFATTNGGYEGSKALAPSTSAGEQSDGCAAAGGSTRARAAIAAPA